MSNLRALGSTEAETQIIAVDLHARQQTIAMLNTRTGEVVGRPVVIGGQLGSPQGGIKVTALFDHTTNTQTPVAEIAYARWYPTATALGNWHLLAANGDGETGTRVNIPEVYNPATSTWRQQPVNHLHDTREETPEEAPH